MRHIALFAPLAAAAAMASAVHARPAEVTVSIGPRVQQEAETLGARDLREQADELARTVRDTLAREGALKGARIDLVLTELKPNRPTREQVARTPGLDPIRSVSIGGAAIEGQVTLSDGRVRPVRYDWFSSSIRDVFGFATWGDAERAYRYFANRLASGRI